MKKALCVLLAAILAFSSALCEAFENEIQLHYIQQGGYSLEFDPLYFEGGAYEYSHELMRASMVVSRCGVGTLAHYGLDGDYGRDAIMQKALHTLGFSDYRAYNFDFSLNTAHDLAGYVFGRMPLSEGESLILALVRGANYGAEWGGNFRVGTGDTHAGYQTAADDLLRTLDEYVALLPADEEIKIWFTGFSRGAAVANLSARALVDRAQTENVRIPAENIYAYLFACPATCIAESVGAGRDLYGNIFNISAVCDVVARMPVAQWGYGRFGIDLQFGDPRKGEAVYAPVFEEYERLSSIPFDFEAYQRVDAQATALMADMARIMTDRETYAREWEPLLSEFLVALYMRVNAGMIPEAAVSALTSRYARKKWAQSLSESIGALAQDEWTEGCMTALTAMYGTEAIEAFQRVSVPASAAGLAGEKAKDMAFGYLALADINASRVSLQTGVQRSYLSYLPMLPRLSKMSELMHWHTLEIYLSFLMTLDEKTLFE